MFKILLKTQSIQNNQSEEVMNGAMVEQPQMLVGKAGKNFHGAAGQIAGYLFQPERALHRLACSPRGSLVGIETLDDITVRFSDGASILEQAKHYTTNKKPFSDRSREFWNTLKVWLDTIDAEDLDMANTALHLVTNAELKSGFVYDLMRRDKSGETSSSFVARLRKIGKSPPRQMSDTFASILGYPDERLAAVMECIQVYDSNTPTHGPKLREELLDRLHLPPSHATEIIQGLLGWIDELVIDLIRSKKAAWITRAAFSEQYRRLLFRYQDIAFVRETEEATVPVSDNQRNERRSRLYVKQLQWVGLTQGGEDDQVLEAIDAEIRSATEAARLSQMGIVTVAEFRAFDARLVKRWKKLRRVHFPESIPESETEQAKLGRSLLSQTLLHLEPLAGHPTQEGYLTEGAYHKLADEPAQLGWHPHYVNKIKALSKDP